MKKLLILLFAISSLFSCESEEKKPDYVWSEERFTEVLTELQMAESVVRLGYNRLPDSLYLNDSIYNAAFRKVNTNKVEFDSNMNYYLQRPEQLEKIYDQVIVNLSTRLGELKAKQNEEENKPPSSL